MTYKIVYWDNEANEQKERDATLEEAAEFDARKSAPAPVPASVSRFQARAALSNAGLLTNAQNAVNSSANPIIQLAWSDAQEFVRSSPTVATLSTALGLTSDQVDELFRQASQIVA